MIRQCGGRFPSNQIRRVLWEDDVIGHVWGIGHICESYIYARGHFRFVSIRIQVTIAILTLPPFLSNSTPHPMF
jgi:hypothetical protein